MRSQFNEGGDYHLILHPNILPAVTINVPSNQGTLLQSGRGVIFADVNISWWASQIQNLETKADPTHLPLYLTDNVLLHIGKDIFNCCVIGFHGTRAPGSGGGTNNAMAMPSCRPSPGPRTCRPASTPVPMVARTGRCRISTPSAMRSPSGAMIHL